MKGNPREISASDVGEGKTAKRMNVHQRAKHAILVEELTTIHLNAEAINETPRASNSQQPQLEYTRYKKHPCHTMLAMRMTFSRMHHVTASRWIWYTHHQQHVYLKSRKLTNTAPVWISEAIDCKVNKVEGEIDTTAEINILPLYLYERMCEGELEEATVRMRPFKSPAEDMMGQIYLHLHTNQGVIRRIFQVANEKGHFILSWQLCEELRYVN